MLVAGGTARYELLEDEVERAGGGMRVKNENPDKAVHLKKGTRFRSPAGVEYVSKVDVTVPKAKRDVRRSRTTVRASCSPGRPRSSRARPASSWRPTEDGPTSATDKQAQYEIVGLKGKDADNTYGLSEKITLEKQDFQGIRAAYEFDPKAEKYIPVDPMKKARWYPTLVGLDDGRVSRSPASTTSA